MYKAIISEAFESDLDSTLTYIRTVLFNDTAADNLLDATEDKVAKIAENPTLYPIYHDDDIARRGYHYAIVGNFLIFFTVNDEEKSVFIARFLYGGQNISDKI